MVGSPRTTWRLLALMGFILLLPTSPCRASAFTIHGLGANWTNFKDSDAKETKFVGRYATSRPKMESIWIQPTVACRLSDNLSFAVGLALVHTHVLLEQSVLNPYDDGRTFGEQVSPKIFPAEDAKLGGNIVARLLPEGRSRFAGVSNNIGGTAGRSEEHTSELQSLTNI